MTHHPPRAIFLLVFSIAILSFPISSSADHHENWVEVRSQHFTVLSNGGEHEGRTVALQFENVRALFLHLYPSLRVDSGKPTIVFALKNEDSLKLLIPAYGQNSKAMKIGGFYHVGYDKNFAVIRTDFRTVGPIPYHSLYHEYTHAYFRYNFRGLPIWLDEGLAEFYGNTSIDNKLGRVGLPNENQVRYLAQNPFIPISELVTIDRSSPLYNTQEHAGIFYAESWALVHYLMVSPDNHQQDLINKYLKALRESDDPITAAQQTFGDLKKLSANLEGYVRRGQYYYQSVPLDLTFSEKDYAARNLSPAEGALALADYLLRSNHLPEGLERLHEVEQLNPQLPGLHSELGHYHFYSHDYVNAEKELKLGIEENPNDISAHLDLANLYYRRDGYTRESTTKIRAELEKVLAVNPDFSPAYAFLSVAYRQEPDKNPLKSFNAAKRASDLEPGRLAYLGDIGSAYLAMNRISDARKVAETMHKLAITPEDRNTAANFNKQVEYKIGHPEQPLNDSASASASTSSLSKESEVTDTTETTKEIEGQVTELLCGHPPEVLLTLNAAADALLLHVTDVSKIKISDAGKTIDPSQLPCSKWKERPAKVTYRPLDSGLSKGEILSISLN